jgi:hypothetical protein
LNKKTYKENEVQCIVQGLLPDNWSMANVKPDGKTMIRGFKTKALRRQHAVLFFLTPGTLMAEDDMQGAKRQFGKISNMGLNPIVVIARADEIEPDIRNAPMSKFAEIEKQRETTAQAFGIPLSRVHIAVPYCAEEQRVFDIERQAYNVLDSAMQAAVEFKTLSAEAQRDGAVNWGDEEAYLAARVAAMSTVAMPAAAMPAAAIPTAKAIGATATCEGVNAKALGNAHSPMPVARPVSENDRMASAAMHVGSDLMSTSGNSNQSPDQSPGSSNYAGSTAGTTTTTTTTATDSSSAMSSAMAAQMELMRKQNQRLQAQMRAMEQKHKEEMAAQEEIRSLCSSGGACAELFQTMFDLDE